MVHHACIYCTSQFANDHIAPWIQHCTLLVTVYSFQVLAGWGIRVWFVRGVFWADPPSILLLWHSRVFTVFNRNPTSEKRCRTRPPSPYNTKLREMYTIISYLPSRDSVRINLREGSGIYIRAQWYWFQRNKVTWFSYEKYRVTGDLDNSTSHCHQLLRSRIWCRESWSNY